MRASDANHELGREILLTLSSFKGGRHTDIHSNISGRSWSIQDFRRTSSRTITQKSPQKKLGLLESSASGFFFYIRFEI